MRGVRPGAPVNHSGRCHKAHIGASRRLALRALIRDCRRGRTYPLHPISSPDAYIHKSSSSKEVVATIDALGREQGGDSVVITMPRGSLDGRGAHGDAL